MAGGGYDEMTCQELVELVTDYLEGRLPEGDRVRLEAHVADCRHCADYIAQMRKTIKALGALPAEALDRSREAELLEAFRAWRTS